MCLGFGLLRAASRMIRAVVGCLCLGLLGGPIMVIVGIVMIATPNTRQTHVDNYNNAVASFNVNVMQAWTGTIDGYSITLSNPLVAVQGSTEGVKQGTSAIASATVSNQPTLVNVNINPVTAFTLSNIPYQSTGSARMYCTKSRCTSSCTSSPYYCSSTSMQNACSSQYSGVYGGGSCSSSASNCSLCTWTTYLTAYCAVVSKNAAGQWVQDATLRSCNYPFRASDQTFSRSSGTTPQFQIYTAGDPYIALQRETEGSNNFGLTRAQQTGVGIGLVASGCVLIALVGVGVFFVYKMVIATSNAINNNNSGQLSYPVNHEAAYVQAIPQVSPVYGQPQQQPYSSYGQPPPQHYAPPQQQPYSYAPPQQQQYGQPPPQPGYGQPQYDPYGQPAYGAPPPKTVY